VILGDYFVVLRGIALTNCSTTLTQKLSPAAEASGEGLSEGAKDHKLACRGAGNAQSFIKTIYLNNSIIKEENKKCKKVQSYSA